MDAPPPAPDLEEVLTTNGAKLHVEHFRPQGPPGGALVSVHGFAAHCGLYRHVGAALAAHGIAVTQFDCRGHGRSDGRRGYVRRFDDYLSDLEVVMARARTVAGLSAQQPLALMGHSHGATVALDYVLSGRGKPDRLVLATPYLALKMRVPGYKRLLARLVGQVWPTLTMGNEIRPQDVSRNPAVIENFDKDPLVHRVATPRWYLEVLAAQARIIAAADRLHVPTLLLVVGQDRIVSTETALTFARAAGPRVTVRQYDTLFHELFLEPEREQVVTDIAAWLTAPPSQQSDVDQARVNVPGIL